MDCEFREHGTEQNTVTQEGETDYGPQKFRNAEVRNSYCLSNITFLNLGGGPIPIGAW
jgi:hypothetical protein